MKELAGTWKCENPGESILFLPLQGLNVFAEAGLLGAQTCWVAEAPGKFPCLMAVKRLHT